MSRKRTKMLSLIMVFMMLFQAPLISVAEDNIENEDFEVVNDIESTDVTTDEIVIESDANKGTDETNNDITNDELSNETEDDLIDDVTTDDISDDESFIDKINEDDTEDEEDETYVVTFIDGIDSEVYATFEVNKGESVVDLPEVPEHDGYEFVKYEGNYTNVYQDETVYACYGYLNNDDVFLVDTLLSIDIDGYTIYALGYMPKDTHIEVESVDNTYAKNTIANSNINGNINFSPICGFTIKLVYDNQVYQPDDFDENVEIRILPIQSNEELYGYQILNNGVLWLFDVDVNEDENVVFFDYDDFATYIIGYNDYSIIENCIYGSYSADIYGKSHTDWYKDFDYKLSGSTIYLKHYIGTSEVVYIPSYVKIGRTTYYTKFEYINDNERFFKDQDVAANIKAVVLGNDSICLYTANFAGLKSIKTVNLPGAYVTSDSVFKDCTSLEEVCVRSIYSSNYTFENCSNLCKVEVVSDFITGKDNFKNASNRNTNLIILVDSPINDLYEVPLSRMIISSNYAFRGLNCNILKIICPDVEIYGESARAFANTNARVIDFTEATIDATYSEDVDGFFQNSSIEEIYFGDNARLIGNFNQYDNGWFTDAEYGPWYTNLFKNCKNLKIVDWPNADSTGIVSINSMFYGCESLEILNLGPNFTCSDVSKGLEDGDSNSGTHQYDAGMTDVFRNCKSLKTLDLSAWDNRNTLATNSMFYGCESLETIKFGENFTCENCLSITDMFKNCKSLKYIDLSSFKLNSMVANSSILKGCDALIVLDTPIVTNDLATSLPFSFYETTDDHTEYTEWKKFPANMSESHRIWRYMHTVNVNGYFVPEDGEEELIEELQGTYYYCQKNDPEYFNIIEDLDLNTWWNYGTEHNYDTVASNEDGSITEISLGIIKDMNIKFVYTVKKDEPVISDSETPESPSVTEMTTGTSNNSSSVTNNITVNTTVEVNDNEPEIIESTEAISNVGNPQTGDDITILIVLAGIMLFGIGLTIYAKRKMK